MRFRITPALAISALLGVAGTCLAEGHDEVGAQGEITSPEHAKPSPAEAHEAEAKRKVYYRPFCRRSLRDQPQRATLVMPSLSAPAVVRAPHRPLSP
jgi:hypothetical protein